MLEFKVIQELEPNNEISEIIGVFLQLKMAELNTYSKQIYNS
ncbi:MAG: hypothetical protein Q4D02_05980 [Clostridia bacterium]|nr:hypothetical protein [Clostridia bacterium]